MLDKWYLRPIDRRATFNGELGVDDKPRKQGEFEPFYIPRDVMPQIDEADLPDLLRHATSKGVIIRLVRHDPKDLKFHQRVSLDKTRSMDAETLAKPVLASCDSFILDGNHRLAKHKETGTPVDAIELQLEFEDAIAFLYSFSKTYAYGDGNFHPVSH